MRVLDAKATAAALPYEPLIAAVAAAMRARRAGTLSAPDRTVLPLPAGGTYLVMPAVDARLAVTKLVTVHPANRAAGLPTIHAQVLVADAATGQPLAMLDGPTVTARRTAALTVLGIRTLACAPVEELTLVGTGAQASAHAAAFAQTLSLRTLRIVGRTPEQAQRWCEANEGLATRSMQLVPEASIDSALAHSQCVVTATTSRTPVLPEEALRAELLVVGVGAFKPELAEIPPGAARSRRVVVDDLHGARTEAGDLLQAGIDWSRVGELVDALDRSAPREGVIFKTVGHAAWDHAAAAVACRALRLEPNPTPEGA